MSETTLVSTLFVRMGLLCLRTAIVMGLFATIVFLGAGVTGLLSTSSTAQYYIQGMSLAENHYRAEPFGGCAMPVFGLTLYCMGSSPDLENSDPGPLQPAFDRSTVAWQ